jgi:GR25 family glycosyltransferase involved in LPS biosynthesis
LQIPISAVPWLSHRDLSLGEISVLMKHFFAISSIANSDCAYGLIVEDDARYDPTKKQLFDKLIKSLESSQFDYVDLAGGCGLLPSREELASSRDDITCTLQIPRTRTNAAYIMSRRLAKVICEAYFPLVFPIDWHLQYLFLKNSEFHYTWTNTPLLIHGSERGYVTSWREENGFS